MPLALLEAMAAGRAPVVSALDGLADLCGPAILVPPEDPAALAGAVTGLLRDSNRRADLGAEARRHVEALLAEADRSSYEGVFLACADRPTGAER
jgi:glycosyltransferase involved in cell wall biosynthesis